MKLTSTSLIAFLLLMCMPGPHAQAMLIVSPPNAKPIHHYVFFSMDREKIKDAKSFLETPAFEGAQVSYSWNQLEHGKDEYDFGMIREDLAFLNSKHKKLWI